MVEDGKPAKNDITPTQNDSQLKTSFKYALYINYKNYRARVHYATCADSADETSTLKLHQHGAATTNSKLRLKQQQQCQSTLRVSIAILRNPGFSNSQFCLGQFERKFKYQGEAA